MKKPTKAEILRVADSFANEVGSLDQMAEEVLYALGLDDTDEGELFEYVKKICKETY